MPKKSLKELDTKRNLRLYSGDWGTLERILGPKRITPTTFIRELVHKVTIRMEAQLSVVEQPVKDLSDDDIRDIITTQPSEPEIAE